MKKIEAKELSIILSEIAKEEVNWTSFIDEVAERMVQLGYASEDILDLEYMGDEYDYIFNQAENFWRIFKKRK